MNNREGADNNQIHENLFISLFNNLKQHVSSIAIREYINNNVVDSYKEIIKKMDINITDDQIEYFVVAVNLFSLICVS